MVTAFVILSLKKVFIIGSGKKVNINITMIITAPITILGYFTFFSRDNFPHKNDALKVRGVFFIFLSFWTLA